MGKSINIGRTIAWERRRAGVTQEALAAHLGVSKAAVSKWELGQSLPDVSLLPRIAAYFSLTLDELFDWRDELSQEESAALYAEVYALGEKDLGAAHERLHALASEHSTRTLTCCSCWRRSSRSGRAAWLRRSRRRARRTGRSRRLREQSEL